MLKESAYAAGYKCGSIGLGLIFSLIMAPVLGPERWGDYVFSLGVIMVAQVVVGMGLGMYATRRIASYNYHDSFGRAQVLKRRVLEIFCGNSIIVTFILLVAAGYFDGLSIYVCAALPFLSLQGIVSVYYKASKRPAMGVFLGEFVTRLLMCIIALVCLYIFKVDHLGADLVFSSSQVVSGCLALVCCWQMGKLGRGARLGAFRWWSSFRSFVPASRVFYYISLVFVFNSYLGVFLVKTFSDNTSVGQFGLASRLAMFMSMPLMLLNSLIGPVIVEKLNGPKRELEITLRRCVLGVLALSSPVFALLVLAPGWVLSFWGEGFAPAKSALLVLALGQFYNLSTGSVGMVLSMGGGESINLRALLWSMLVNVISSALFIPVYGALGAAISTSLSVVFMNAYNSYFVYREHGLILFPPLYFIKSRSI